MTSYQEVNKKQYNILKNHFRKVKLKIGEKKLLYILDDFNLFMMVILKL